MVGLVWFSSQWWCRFGRPSLNRPESSEGFSDCRAAKPCKAFIVRECLRGIWNWSPKPSPLPMLSLGFPSEPGFLTDLILGANRLHRKPRNRHDVAMLVAFSHQAALWNQPCRSDSTAELLPSFFWASFWSTTESKYPLHGMPTRARGKSVIVQSPEDKLEVISCEFACVCVCLCVCLSFRKALPGVICCTELADLESHPNGKCKDPSEGFLRPTALHRSPEKWKQAYPTPQNERPFRKFVFMIIPSPNNPSLSNGKDQSPHCYAQSVKLLRLSPTSHVPICPG